MKSHGMCNGGCLDADFNAVDKFCKAQLMIIAHRGASAVAPESTAVAIRAAVRAGAGMIELDVQMTRDGRLVVFHDERLDRTTNGRGRLARQSYARLARLDAGSWFHPRFTGERILLVSHALRLIPSRVRVNLELKSTPRGDALVSAVRRLVRGVHRQGRVLISSFDATVLRLARSCGLPIALIDGASGGVDADRALRRAIRLGCAAWHPSDRIVTCRRVLQAHAAGLRVRVWTVDERRRARQLRRWGVDGIFTNDPARLRRGLSR